MPLKFTERPTILYFGRSFTLFALTETYRPPTTESLARAPKFKSPNTHAFPVVFGKSAIAGIIAKAGKILQTFNKSAKCFVLYMTSPFVNLILFLDYFIHSILILIINKNLFLILLKKQKKYAANEIWRSGGLRKSPESMTPPAFGKPCFYNWRPPDPIQAGFITIPDTKSAQILFFCGFNAAHRITFWWVFLRPRNQIPLDSRRIIK